MKNILVLDGEDQLAKYEDAEWVKRITDSSSDVEDLMIGATPPSTIPTAVIQGGEKDKPKIKSLE